MSSILRALKKLENEPRHQEGAPALESKFVSLAETEPQRSGFTSLLRVMGAGIVCGLVILAGWWFFSAKMQPSSPITQQDPAPGPGLAETSPAASPAMEKELPPAVLEAPEMSAVETGADQETASLAAEQEPAAPAEEPAFIPIADPENVSVVSGQRPEEAFAAGEASAPEKDEQLSEPAAEAAETVVASIRPSPPPAKPVEVKIPRLNDPDMKLQAVTWSKIPQKRIAVINNRILREGDLVSGYLIKTINPDDVIVILDGEKWKLLFR